MKLKIGFRGYEKEENTNMHVTEPVVAAPVKSVVQVRFPSDGRSFAYYNDGFDLKVGDVVFVEGKFEGLQGIVTEVSHSFRIKLSDYKRVIAKAVTHVSGALYFGGSHLIAFDDTVILLYINPSIYYNFNIMLIKFDENTEDYSEASF